MVCAVHALPPSVACCCPVLGEASPLLRVKSLPWLCSCLQVLQDVFGVELAPEVAARYLQEQAGGRYRFRQAYARCASVLLAAVWRPWLQVTNHVKTM